MELSCFLRKVKFATYNLNGITHLMDFGSWGNLEFGLVEKMDLRYVENGTRNSQKMKLNLQTALLDLAITGTLT